MFARIVLHSLRQIYRTDFIMCSCCFAISKSGLPSFSNNFWQLKRARWKEKEGWSGEVVCELQKTSITFGQLTRLSCIWLMYSLNVCVWMTSFKHKCNHKNSTTTWNNLSPRFKRCATAEWILYTSWGKLLLFLRALAFKFESCVNLQKKICTQSVHNTYTIPHFIYRYT